VEFRSVIQKRKSIRAYQPEEVTEEKIQEILEAVNLAPTAGNLQPFRVFVVRDEKKRRALSRAALEQEFIAEAPVVLVFFALPEESEWRYGERGRTLYCIQDATIATAYAQLSATDVGLASCWVGAYDDQAVRRILGAPDNWLPVSILPIGIPAEDPVRPERKPIARLIIQA